MFLSGLRAGFQATSVTPFHAQLAGDREMSHCDLFDQMPAAQVNQELIFVVTIDKALLDFPIQIMNS